MSNRNFFKAGDSGQKNDRRKHRQGFQPPRMIEDHWDFFNKSLYVEPTRRSLPAWLLPLVVLLAIVLVVFWAAPALVSRLQEALHIGSDSGENNASLLYGDDTWTVIRPVADVYTDDDIKASRRTQALYNEPVKILPDICSYGFARVQLSDGSDGFMKTADLVDSRDSIEPDLFRFKLVIAETTKRILSHASRGTLLVEVPMGTVLFADYRGNGISRVRLPGGESGWISDDGVIILEPTAEIEPVAEGVRYFCSTALAFSQITVLPEGQSVYGISTVGIARLAAAINGITLPRLLEDQAESGKPAELITNEETGMTDPASIKAGYLVFLSARGRQDGIAAELAICVADGQVLYAGSGQSSIRLVDLGQDTTLLGRILFARKLYD